MHTYWRYRRALPSGRPVLHGSCARRRGLRRQRDLHVLGCSGIATGVPTLADSYVFRADIIAADFISFGYSSSDANFEITTADAPILLGGLKADGSIVGILVVQVMKGTNPFFEVGPAPDRFFVNTDRGEMFTFTLVGGAVPDPPPGR